MFGLGNGFRKPKKLNRKQREKQETSEQFIKDYEVVCKKHGLQLDAKIEVTPNGVVPKIQILEFKPEPEKPDFETKDWDECKKENEETRKKLREEEEERKKDMGGTAETIKD